MEGEGVGEVVIVRAARRRVSAMGVACRLGGESSTAGAVGSSPAFWAVCVSFMRVVEEELSMKTLEVEGPAKCVCEDEGGVFGLA